MSLEQELRTAPPSSVGTVADDLDRTLDSLDRAWQRLVARAPAADLHHAAALRDVWDAAERIDLLLSNERWATTLQPGSPAQTTGVEVGWHRTSEARARAAAALSALSTRVEDPLLDRLALLDPKVDMLAAELRRLRRGTRRSRERPHQPISLSYAPLDPGRLDRLWSGVLTDVRRDLAARRRLEGTRRVDEDELFAEVVLRHRRALAGTVSEGMRHDLATAQARGFPSAQAAAWWELDVEEALGYQVQDIIREDLDSLHTLLRAKCDILGQSPMPVAGFRTSPGALALPPLDVNRAWGILVSALEPLGGDYLDVVRRARRNGWVRLVEPRARVGRRAGSAFQHGHDPVVVVSWSDSWPDLFSLAHELGHAVHRWVASRNQRPSLAAPPGGLIEVPALLNELLVAQHLLEDYDLNLDVHRLAMVQRMGLLQQNGFTACAYIDFAERVEREVYEHGEADFDTLCRLYRRSLDGIYADTVATQDAAISRLWARRAQTIQGHRVLRYVLGIAVAAHLSTDVADVRSEYWRVLATGRSRSLSTQLDALGFPADRGSSSSFARVFRSDLGGWLGWLAEAKSQSPPANAPGSTVAHRAPGEDTRPPSPPCHGRMPAEHPI